MLRGISFDFMYMQFTHTQKKKPESGFAMLKGRGTEDEF